MNESKVNLVKELLTKLPRRYEDKHLDLVYRHGYLIGLLSELADKHHEVRRVIQQRIKDLQ